MEEGLGESSGTPQLLSVSKDETPGQKADEISVVEVNKILYSLKLVERIPMNTSISSNKGA